MRSWRWMMGLVLFTVLFWCGAAGAQAEEIAGVTLEPMTTSLFTAQLRESAGTVDVRTMALDGEEWLFLPAFADASTLSLIADETLLSQPLCWQTEKGDIPFVSGEPFDWHAVSTAAEEGVTCATLANQSSGEAVLTLNVMQSQNVRSFFLFSDDPVNQGRIYIESSIDHSTYTTGAMALINRDGGYDYGNNITKLRGRGNGTWTRIKRGYQFKLENKADLLQTGDPTERARTWVLLAMWQDRSAMRAKMSLDLARELGLSSTSSSEWVDLYYDGEYRGLYLLCEKVEVDEARVDVLDYDALLEEWNGRMGQHDLDALPQGSAVNDFGNPYYYVEGVQDLGDVTLGGYLLELEQSLFTLSDRCWFRTSDGSEFAIKSPENASKAMVKYVSELMELGIRAMRGRGVDAETGVRMEDVIDVDSFAISVLVNELSYNIDGFFHSSTYFVLPQGESKIYAGPVWDFDLAWRYTSDGKNAGGVGFKDHDRLLTLFYGCVRFNDRMAALAQEKLAPALEKLLGAEEENGSRLSSIDEMEAHILAARAMDHRRWGDLGFDYRLQGLDDPIADTELLRTFVRERGAWFLDTMEAWDATSADNADLWLDAVYTLTESTARLVPYPLSNVRVKEFSIECVSEATEEEFALWQGTAILEPSDERIVFGEELHFSLSGVPVKAERLSDTEARMIFRWRDPSYRPVDYYGTDVGLAFNKDYFAKHYPESVEAAEGDWELILDEFFMNGIYEGQVGNSFFSPTYLLWVDPNLMDSYGDDEYTYYDAFLNGENGAFMTIIDLNIYSHENARYRAVAEE